MRVLEALRILEAAVYECKARAIDTPEVCEALDLLEPICREPDWIVGQFRHHLRKSPDPFAPWSDGGAGQQQVLRVSFSGIYGNVRRLLDRQIGRLGAKYLKTKDPKVREEIDRLSAELAKMPPAWDFTPGEWR